MAKKQKSRPKKHHHSHKRITRLNTWTRDENVPFAETEYPFEHAVAVGEYSELFQRDMGPGLILYPSTICLSRQDSQDSTVLALLGEHFREFHSEEMPWLSMSTEKMCAAMLVRDVEELNETLTHLAGKGFLDLDLSLPDTYRYRLNVRAVRKAKNACFKQMNPLEQIEHDYVLRFPDIETQQLAFTLICERSRYQGYILVTAWHLSLRDTPWFTKHTTGKLDYLRAEEIFTFLPASISDEEQQQQALGQLVKRGFLRMRLQGQLREYRPNVVEMWEALSKLPQELPSIEAVGGYVDGEDNLSEEDE
ncbi:hypothetical protein [Ktedonobacter racemifer]|uniref:Uncharacterized protein n=1 Tax=Ktedonobacter racemifer DSM 44963 TaxID=485913 RepID=D6TKV4_KTERA|nr:hypothetical protein [Ktedonobacter racemifer]EFH86404.1 hypothetical protein Krac_7702 [Ktedonobacter racemifer DSM 44963]